MQRLTRILMVALLLAAVLPPGTASAFGSPTAIIVDDETGAPIEGAIALAQWMKYSWLRRWMEGGTYYLTKAEETVSDKEGKIYIKGYWNDFSFSGKPHLTVYKPGYALWNSDIDIIPVEDPPPKGFNRFTKVVRLVKFEKAAEEWKKIAYTDYERKRPRALNLRFLSMCLDSDLNRNAITIDKVVDSNEWPFVREEENKLRSEHENSKN